MSDHDSHSGVKFKTATVQRIFVVGAILFFLMAVAGIVGEILGWWNDVGEIVTIVGTLGSLMLGSGALSTGASQEQVSSVHRAVVDNGRKLDTLDVIQHELDRQTGVLDEQLTVLCEVRDGL